MAFVLESSPGWKAFFGRVFHFYTKTYDDPHVFAKFTSDPPSFSRIFDDEALPMFRKAIIK